MSEYCGCYLSDGTRVRVEECSLHELRRREMIELILCKILGWHKVMKVDLVDEVNSSGYCVRCGSRCLLDGQGNWFRASRQDRNS